MSDIATTLAYSPTPTPPSCTIQVEWVRQAFYPEALAPATAGSAGIDLRACLDKPLTLYPNQSQRVPAGIKVALPRGTVLFLLPRSGLGSQGLVLGNLVGVIDSDYRGEVEISLWNRSDELIEIEPGTRVAQAVPLSCSPMLWTVVEKLDETPRGSGGFGST